MSKKVLLIEDEPSIRSFLKINFIRNNFTVIEAVSGEDGLEKAALESPEISILDISLPGMDGFQACKALRKLLPKVGIIILTARNQDMDKIMGLEFGADDYMTKPFNPLELIARVNALLRRIDNNENNENIILHCEPFLIDNKAKKVYKNNMELDLTPKEYQLMQTLIENKGKALNRDELLDSIWGYNYFGDSKVVDVNIRRLREKIEDDSSSPKYIETVWGLGYRWRKD